MEIKSIKNNRPPNYPTIELFIQHPELLSKNIPNSWVTNKFVITSLAAFLLCGCNSGKGQMNEKTVIVNNAKNNDSAATAAESVANANKIIATTNIAPIFAHGDGRGAAGCVVMSPPVFLSEDETMKIILDALRAEGYNFSTEKCPIFSFEVPPLANSCGETNEKVNIQLKMDAYNANSKWAVQFITIQDFDKFFDESAGCWSSVSYFKTKEAAEIINNELKKKKKTNAVVFYDPITRVKTEDWSKYEASRELAEKEAKDLLLAQVNDFITWLKKNNITIE